MEARVGLYVDDDAAAKLLIQLLRQAGHDVFAPREDGTTGLADARHFARAIADSRVLLTFNYDDFQDLHLLLKAAAGRHPGLIVGGRTTTPHGI